MKRKKLLFSLFCFAIIIGLTIPFSLPAQASPTTIYVPDHYPSIQAAVDAASPGDTIIVRDGTYTENVDVNKEHLTIQSENGAAATIVQAANSDDHVFEVTADYVNISGFTIKKGKIGIYLNSASYCNISNNTVISNDRYGVLLGYSNSNSLTGNTANWNNGLGISLSYSNNNVLTKNTANLNKSSGIEVYRSGNNNLTENTANSNKEGWAGIFLAYSSSNILTRNTANSNNGSGIRLDSLSTDNTLTENIANSNDDHGILLVTYFGYLEGHNILSNNIVNSNGYSGITISSYGNNTLINNTVLSNSRYGIRLESSNNNNITDNDVLDNEYGIRLGSSSNNILSNNTMSGNKYNFGVYGSFIQNIDTSNTIEGKPIYYWVSEQDRQIPCDAGYVGIINSTNITVRDLTLTNNGQGILLVNSGNSRIENVKVLNNTFGIYLYSSNNNILTNNIVSNNEYGIYVSSDNIIYLNNFINNTDNPSSSTNTWNSPEEITYTYNGNAYTNYLGNYWDDYTGNDADGDGIGDSPYPIDGDSDNYPLIEPFESYGLGDSFADLGNAEDEATHNLLGWGDVQGPPENPYVSPSGDRTKRYQILRGTNSLDLWVEETSVDHILTTEVEDGHCTDNFEIYINGQGPVYTYEGKHLDNAVVVHTVVVPGAYIPEPLVTVTFRNTSTDDCGLAAVYNVGLAPAADVTPPDTEITIGPSGTIDYNDVTFTWTGSDDVTLTSDLVYSYYLDGYDSGWSAWTTSTMAEYLDLPDDDYTFKVRAKDQAGNIDPTPAERAVEVDAEWSFAIITDLHVGRGYADYGGEGIGPEDWQVAGQEYYLTERLRSVVQWINESEIEKDIRFVVVLGDISDSGECSELKKAREILDVLNTIDVPYIPVIGNHDVLPHTDEEEFEHVRYFEFVFRDQFEKLEGDPSFNLRKQPDPEPGDLQNYAFEYGDIQFIVLDLAPREHSPLAVLWDSTLLWLTENLRADKPTIIFSHHPFVSPDGGFLPQDIITIDEAIKIGNADVLANFAGHVHGYYDPHKRWAPWAPFPFKNPIFMDANTIFYGGPPAVPEGIDVITTEAMMVASNEPTPKGIIRIVKAEGEEITIPVEVEGEFRALNPYFKKVELHVPEGMDFVGPIGDLIRRTRKIRIDFEAFAFTKRVSEEHNLLYFLQFEDGSWDDAWSDEVESVEFEPHYIDVPYPEEYLMYDVDLTVIGWTPEGERISEDINRSIALPQPLVFHVASPADMAVTDPDGFVISKQSNEIPEASYTEIDLNGDGSPEDIVYIRDRKMGDYLIEVIPEPGASPTDSYALEVSAGGQTTVMADHVSIADIPSQPYVIESTETEIKAAPIANGNGPYVGAEGSPISFNGTGSYDPDGSIALYEWDFDDDGVYDFDSGLSSASYVYGDDYRGNVTLRVTDNDGLTSFDIAPATVLNVAPIVGNITAPQDPVPVNTPVYATGNFTDPGILDTHTAEWDWGDGNMTAGTVTEIKGSGNVTGSHAYTTPGVYTVKLTVTDDDGDSGQSVLQYVVVYDGSAGFVTGGGWINSPEGAYAADPSLTGKANFGFVSKYKKGATTPTGQTEFQFKVADLNFHSDSYDWLVIAGHKAKYKGTGTINGDGNYGFMLSAIDEKLTPSTDVDLFRIKIWDKDDGDAIVYDNQMEAADDADPATDIGGGSIVIHKGN